MALIEVFLDQAGGRRRAAVEGRDPDGADREIDEEGIGEVVHRRRRHRIDAADRRNGQQQQRGDAAGDIDRLQLADFLEIDRRRGADEAIGDDEAEGRAGAGIVEEVEQR